ncbi:hypothetical protein GCM10007897_34190 [Sphingobium jiangsuense]|uniref:Na+/H+ antiporter NhaB n=1 Tax=Sphingobium jiangsuense TaxID=870476 RepID=A0A7W6BHQ1_9SPHN|nr:hypothetical protein [Sphingobium jiangsuense]MBB3925221.1 Na+/H+ antiporter NhaB [Sphingobium jiangsuense]GLT02016.1 hypothetical protein GCM10007897_34190 [Sphingobium jiangsuense]
MNSVAQLSSWSGTLLSLLMLAGLMLAAGGVWVLVKQPRNRRQGWLMIVAALVMFGNVAIWTVPVGP